ncbi:MAG: EAL domain-containing protein [Gammaproteobacteria bacterium]|nr:EAL domain-containing protein [Gammaproteobacteria bacterium]
MISKSRKTSRQQHAATSAVCKQTFDSISQHLKSIFNGFSDPLVICDMQSKILFANKAYLKLTDKKQSDVCGKQAALFYPKCVKFEPDRKWTKKQLEKICVGKKIAISENGKSLFVVHMLKDITLLQRSEQKVEKRLRFEKFLSEMVQNYARLQLRDVNRFIQKSLRDIGKFVGVDRTCVALFSEDKNIIKTRYEWVHKKKGIAPLIQHLQHVPIKQSPWFIKQVLAKKIVLVPDIERLPKAANAEKQAWKKMGYKALLAMPLVRRDQSIGFVCFDMFTGLKDWDKEDIGLLHVISELISHTLANQEQQEMIQKRVHFEHFIASISKHFAVVDPLKAPKLFKKVLREIGKFVDVDRTCIALFSKDRSSIQTIHEWVNQQKEIAPLIENLQHVPTRQSQWFVKQILEKEVALVPDIEQLPKAAASEQRAWRKMGYKSLLAVPLVRRGQPIGFVCFDMFTQRKDWAEEDIELLHVFAELISDLLERKDMLQTLLHKEKETMYLSRHDILTGLPNRLAFQELFARELSKAKRHKEQFALLLFDIDHFKNVNDVYGHVIGDDLLKAVAQRVRKNIRTEDFLARLGGDEFIIILSDIDQADQAGIAATKIMQLFQKPFDEQGNEIVTSVSIGIATFPTSGATADELYKNADVAMYKAKDLGRNNYEYFSKKFGKQFQRRLVIENSMRSKQLRNELFVVYQPIVEMATKRIIGAEALLRWRHPEEGLIPPAEFIPIAESIGSIIEIGKWVLQSVYKQIEEWRYVTCDTDFYITVNLSPSQLLDDQTIQQIIQTRSQSKVQMLINLELTESAIIGSLEDIGSKLKFLVNHEFKILVDDFGTGASSLNRLAELPVDVLKIDRSFISGLPENEKHRKIVTSILALAEHLHLDVIAEGVEEKDEYQYLMKQGCKKAQGFYFYKPLLPSKFIQLLRKQSLCDASKQ